MISLNTKLRSFLKIKLVFDFIRYALTLFIFLLPLEFHYGLFLIIMIYSILSVRDLKRIKNKIQIFNFNNFMYNAFYLIITLTVFVLPLNSGIKIELLTLAFLLIIFTDFDKQEFINRKKKVVKEKHLNIGSADFYVKKTPEHVRNERAFFLSDN